MPFARAMRRKRNTWTGSSPFSQRGMSVEAPEKHDWHVMRTESADQSYSILEERLNEGASSQNCAGRAEITVSCMGGLAGP